MFPWTVPISLRTSQPYLSNLYLYIIVYPHVLSSCSVTLYIVDIIYIFGAFISSSTIPKDVIHYYFIIVVWIFRVEAGRRRGRRYFFFSHQDYREITFAFRNKINQRPPPKGYYSKLL